MVPGLTFDQFIKYVVKMLARPKGSDSAGHGQLHNNFQALPNQLIIAYIDFGTIGTLLRFSRAQISMAYTFA